MLPPLQPHASWYRRYWYGEHSPLGALLDRVLIFAVAVLTLLAGITLLER
jgi:hypothetical protein